MLIVAVAWIYVVGLMALTELTVVGGIMTFLGYCVLPLSIVWYIFGRRKKRGAALPSPTAAEPPEPPAAPPEP